ncbi:MAG: imidazole glycerol phosphate synthase subunit HisF [Oscillospiraceae bacterium]|nr:imidazole glycerol phosphate synthase subunit HisF [Oscillospiraceae bacterium]
MPQAKRVIPALDIKDGRVVTGISFMNLRDAGDPVECARAYEKAGADELCLLDINATHEGRGTTLDVVERVLGAVHIPLTVSGGVRSAEDFETLLNAGASKVCVNSAAVRRPALLDEAALRFGSERVALAIDAKALPDGPDGPAGRWELVINGGRLPTGIDAVAWAVEAARRGAGEILLNSVDRDGQETGYDLALTRAVSEAVPVPVIASSGAGALEHFYEAIVEGKADAVLAATLFHFGIVTVGQVKDYLEARGIVVRR